MDYNAKLYDDITEFLSPRICRAIEDLGANVNGYMTDRIDDLVRAIAETDDFTLSDAAISEVAAVKRACPSCKGAGWLGGIKPCHRCHASGNILLDNLNEEKA